MLKTTKINIELSTIETLNLKRFLGSKGIIDKDLNIAIKKYIQKYMQEEKKVKKIENANIFTINGEEKDKYTFDKEKIILIEFMYNENPDTVTISVVYLNENNIVKTTCICAGNYSKPSWKMRNELIEQVKNVDSIEIRSWESPSNSEHDEIFIFIKHLDSVSVNKKDMKIHIYGPNGYMHSILFTPNNKNHFKDAIKKLKNILNKSFHI